MKTIMSKNKVADCLYDCLEHRKKFADGANIHRINQLLTKLKYCKENKCHKCDNCFLDSVIDDCMKIVIKKKVE